MARMTRAQEIETAKRLLRSSRHKGDHGFVGEGLVAWNTQRNAMRSFLESVSGTYFNPSVRRMVDANAAQCPKNVQWSGGTVGGEKWTNDVRRLLTASLGRRGLRL